MRIKPKEVHQILGLLFSHGLCQFLKKQLKDWEAEQMFWQPCEGDLQWGGALKTKQNKTHTLGWETQGLDSRKKDD